MLAGRPPFLLAARQFGTVGADAPRLPRIADLAPDTPASLAELLDALTGHRPDAAPGSFEELAGRLRHTRPPLSPVRTGGWAIACGAALAGIVGAASLPDPVASPVASPSPATAVAPLSAQANQTSAPARPTKPFGDAGADSSEAIPRVRRVAVPVFGR